MKKTSSLFILGLGLLVGLWLMPDATSAQRGGIRATPSGTPELERGQVTRTAPDNSSLIQPTQPARPGRATRTPIDTSGLPDSLPTLQFSFPTLSAPLASDEAQAAISQFNSDHLGAAIQIVYAGNATGSIQSALAYLPPEIQTAMLSASSISGVTYWGLLSSGGAMVAVGDCASNPAACTVSADSLSVQLSNASAGVYGLLVDGSAATAQDALNLLMRTFPKLNGLSFTPVAEISTGFAFTAVTSTVGFDPTTRQPTAVAEAVTVGTVSAEGKTFAYALVGLGEGYVSAIGA